MEYRILGKTGLRVSAIGFGCWALGGTSYGPVKDEESLDALEAALGKGVNFFDTADIYGYGHSEAILSQFFRNKNKKELIVASKVGHDFYHGPVKKNFEPGYIREACEQSLKRLNIEAIDVYQLHNPALEILERGEAIDALARLKKDGKIRAVGVSVYNEETALACLSDKRIETLQVIFNLIDQKMSFRVLTEAKKDQVGIIAREPLACGMLTGKYNADSVFHKEDHRNGWSRERLKLELEKVEKIKKVLGTERLSLTRAALEYVLEFDSVSTVIPGAKTRKQILENLLAAEEPLLRSQESSLLRDLYQRDPIFKKEIN